MANASQLLKQAAACRDLAKQARRLAFTFIDGPDRERLLRYAEELDGQADALEKQVAALG